MQSKVTTFDGIIKYVSSTIQNNYIFTVSLNICQQSAKILNTENFKKPWNSGLFFIKK